MQPIVWDELRYVLALTRFGTIAEAARRLAVDEGTVARRLARLERRLEARLFDRLQGKLTPTEAGQAAAARAERVEQEIDALEAVAQGADRRAIGRVRLTAVPLIINRLCSRHCPLFLRRIPALR